MKTQHNHHNLQDGPLLAISTVFKPPQIRDEITPVTYLQNHFIGVITPILTSRGSSCKRLKLHERAGWRLYLFVVIICFWKHRRAYTPSRNAMGIGTTVFQALLVGFTCSVAWRLVNWVPPPSLATLHWFLGCSIIPGLAVFWYLPIILNLFSWCFLCGFYYGKSRFFTTILGA